VLNEEERVVPRDGGRDRNDLRERDERGARRVDECPNAVADERQVWHRPGQEQEAEREAQRPHAAQAIEQRHDAGGEERQAEQVDPIQPESRRERGR